MKHMFQTKFIYSLNCAIEKGWRETKRVEGWTEKQISKSIEKLDHIKAARIEIEKKLMEKKNAS